MSTAVQNRNLLDQLTASAAPSPAPPMFAQMTGDGSAPPVTLTPASDSATSDLESLATSPEQMASRIAATQQTEKDQHPGFLDKLKEFASGASGEPGLSGPDSTPRSKGAAIASILGRVGNGLALAAGTPEQKSLAVEQEQIPLKLGQMQNEALYRRGMLGLKDQANQNTATKTGLQYGTGANGAPEGTSRITAEAAQQNADSNEGLRAAHQKQIEASLNGEVFVMPEIAKAIGRPELASTTMSPIKYQQQVANVLKSLGMKSMDLGNEGTWGTSPLTGRLAKISDSSPSQLASSRYMNRPVQAIDPKDGVLKYMAGGDAVAQGAAPGAQGAQIMSKQAQFKDIYSGIANMRHAVAGIGAEPLDAGTISKLTLATRETDPTISHQIFDTVLGTENLTPAQQDFVIAVQQLNERALSLRNLAGMGNGSDQMRAAIRATLPNAKSGSAQMMLKQLDSVTNLVDNLYTGVPRINTGTKTPNAVNPSPSGGNTPNSGPSASSGKQVSLKAAMSLPANQGKSEADVRADIQAHGHKVGP